MQIPKEYIGIVSLCISVCLFLCGCQKAPQNNLIYIDNTEVESGAYTESSAIGENNTTAIYECFDSTDGSVHFELDVQVDPSISSLPTVMVEPHYLTSEDAQRIAYVLFGDVDFYEREPYESTSFSKSEIQDRLERWSNYVSGEALQELYGMDNNSFIQELVKEYIQKYTLKLETAPDNNPHTPCNWKYQEESRYTFTPENVTAEELANDNSAIMANCTVNGINYCFDAVTRNKSDYKLNIVTVYIDSANSPFGIDEAIARAKLCRGEKPNQVQVDAIIANAGDILKEINIGDWVIDTCEVREDYIGEQVEYSIRINALPMLDGTKATDCSPFFELKEDAYASNYYLSNVQFTFAPDGTLLSFELTSPIDILEVSGHTEVTNSTDVMMARAKEVLCLTDWHAYYTSTSRDLSNVSVLCNVKITEGSYGLVRTRVKNHEDQYQYVPAYIISGIYELVNTDTGEIYMYKDSAGIILALNVSNGAIITSPRA